MRVRNMLLTLLLLPIALAAPPVSAQSTTLRVATIAPDGSYWMREMRAGADEIAERTDGRIRIQYFPGGVMGNDQAVLRRIRIGQLQGGAFTGGSLAQVDTNASLYSLPFLFHSREEVDHVRERMDARVERIMEKAGFVSFGLAEGGFARLLSATPVTGTDSLRGQRVWVPEGDPVAYAAMDALGVTPVTLPMTDVLTALQTGLVNVVATPPIGAIAFQWHTRVRYMTDAPLAYTWAQLVIDRRALERLRAEDRAVVDEVLRGTYARLDRQNRLENERATEALVRQGIRIVTPDAAVLQRWREIGDEVTESLVRRGVYDAALYGELRGHLEAFRSR